MALDHWISDGSGGIVRTTAHLPRSRLIYLGSIRWTIQCLPGMIVALTGGAHKCHTEAWAWAQMSTSGQGRATVHPQQEPVGGDCSLTALITLRGDELPRQGCSAPMEWAHGCQPACQHSYKTEVALSPIEAEGQCFPDWRTQHNMGS